MISNTYVNISSLVVAFYILTLFCINIMSQNKKANYLSNPASLRFCTHNQSKHSELKTLIDMTILNVFISCICKIMLDCQSTTIKPYNKL